MRKKNELLWKKMTNGQPTNISMKNSYLITCDNGEKNAFQEPYTIKDTFFVTGVIIKWYNVPVQEFRISIICI